VILQQFRCRLDGIPLNAYHANKLRFEGWPRRCSTSMQTRITRFRAKAVVGLPPTQAKMGLVLNMIATIAEDARIPRPFHERLPVLMPTEIHTSPFKRITVRNMGLRPR